MNALSILAQILYYLLGALQWIILIRILLTWLPMAGIQIDPYNPIIRVLSDITDPILEPLRRYTTFGMMDWSPIVAFFAIRIIQSMLIGFI